MITDLMIGLAVLVIVLAVAIYIERRRQRQKLLRDRDEIMAMFKHGGRIWNRPPGDPPEGDY